MTRAVMVVVLGLSALLPGCENFDTARSGNVIASTVARHTEPQVVVDYSVASTADFRVIDRALTQLKPSTIGQADALNGRDEVEIRFSRGAQVWTSRAAQALRLALPGEVVKARHADATKAIAAFGRYAATRPDAAVARLYVAAPELADRNWMAAQLRKAGIAGVIDEQSQPYTAIGWTTPGLVRDRRVVEERKPS